MNADVGGKVEAVSAASEALRNLARHFRSCASCADTDIERDTWIVCAEEAELRASAPYVDNPLHCYLCEQGFPLLDGHHIPTQSLGMIPITRCPAAERREP